MELRTFYWDATKNGTSATWRAGNAGDVFNRDLAEYLYGATLRNAAYNGGRLLLVGSIVHRVLPGDVVSGVGHKGSPIPPASQNPGVRFLGVRGPLTLAAVQEAGYDVSEVRYQYDPGLLVRVMYADLVESVPAEPGRVVFVPHYRERPQYADRTDVAVIDIDCTPRELVREILRAEHVYSSSLHGLIFSHALGRPCTLVAPLTEEPELKYRDYVASVGLPWTTPPDLDGAIRAPKPTSPFEVALTLDDFAFPTADELRGIGALVD